MASSNYFARVSDDFETRARISGDTINLSIEVDGVDITIFDYTMGERLQLIVDALTPVIAEARTRREVEAEVFARLNTQLEVEA